MFIKLWMQRDVVTIAPDTPLGEAAEIIRQNSFRHLPVVKDEKLVGIITQKDINQALPSAIDSSLGSENRVIAAQAKISSFMVNQPITASPMDPLENVALLMRKFKIGAVPVVENDKLVGIVTETDIFRAFTEIMGVRETGSRIELQIKNNSTAVYKVVEICKEFNMELNAISVYKNFSHEHQLLTIRVSGEEMDQLIDALWDSGAKINQILAGGNTEKEEQD